jgi:hypothetical protein
MSKDTTIVVGCSHQQIKYYLQQMNIPLNQARLVTGVDQVYGYRDTPLIYVGEYWRITDIGKIMEYAAMHNLYTPSEVAA